MIAGGQARRAARVHRFLQAQEVRQPAHRHAGDERADHHLEEDEVELIEQVALRRVRRAEHQHRDGGEDDRHRAPRSPSQAMPAISRHSKPKGSRQAVTTTGHGMRSSTGQCGTLRSRPPLRRGGWMRSLTRRYATTNNPG
jgi:hypothetical protein